MRDQQHAVALVGEGAEVVQRSDRKVEVEPRRWLVGHDYPRVVHERAAEQHAARHAARKLMRIKARNLGTEPVALEQLLAARFALGLRQRVREAFDLFPHAHHGVQMAHALRHERQSVPAQRAQAFRIHALAVEPDASRHRSVRLEQSQHRIGEKRLARARCAHHSHDLARVDGDTQPVEHLDIALLRLEVRRILVVHAKAHVQILDLQKVVPAVMVRRRRMCVMMVQLRILVRGLLVSDRSSLVRRSRLRSRAVVCILQHLPHLFLRRMRVNELSQTLTSHIEEQHRRHERQTREHGKPPGTRR